MALNADLIHMKVNWIKKKNYYQYSKCLRKFMWRIETQEFVMESGGKGIKYSVKHSDGEGAWITTILDGCWSKVIHIFVSGVFFLQLRRNMVKSRISIFQTLACSDVLGNASLPIYTRSVLPPSGQRKIPLRNKFLLRYTNIKCYHTRSIYMHTQCGMFVFSIFNKIKNKALKAWRIHDPGFASA